MQLVGPLALEAAQGSAHALADAAGGDEAVAGDPDAHGGLALDVDLAGGEHAVSVHQKTSRVPPSDSIQRSRADRRPHPAITPAAPDPAQLRALHACIKKVTEDLDHLRFNTAISALMVFVKDAIAWNTRPLEIVRPFLVLLHPFAPHLAEELWHLLDDRQPADPANPARPVPRTLAYAPWPDFDPARIVEDTIEIPVQINGKLRDRIRIAVNATPAQLEQAALAAEKVAGYLAGNTVRKVIVVPGKLVNLVVGP